MNIEKLHDIISENNLSVSIDSRKIEKKSIFFSIKGEKFNGNDYAIEALEKGASIAIVDEKREEFSSIKEIINVDDSLKTLQKLASYHRNNSKAKVIAITGSNGKTTTKELLFNILGSKFQTISTSGNLNNHIGVPLTLLKIKHDTEFAVVELGANNFGEIDFLAKLSNPDYGYITNFGKAHLEGFKNIEGVIKGKTELYNWLIENNKYLFLNFDDFEQLKFKMNSNISFGINKDANYCFELLKKERITVKHDNNIFTTNLYGEYNFSNVCAAISIGLELGVEVSLIISSLEKYKSTNNRSEFIKINDKNVVLDAYNANPTSMELAIKSFLKLKGSKAVILGDMFELGKKSSFEHLQVVEKIKNSSIDNYFFIGNEFYKFNDNENHFFKIKDDFYKTIFKIKEQNILIKGSRAMELEEILNKNII